MKILDNFFFNNLAYENGGCLFLTGFYNLNLEFSRNYLFNNNAYLDGAAIYLEKIDL